MPKKKALSKTRTKSKAAQVPRTPEEKLEGRRVAFFGNFSLWPSYHGGSPETVAARYGAEVVATVDQSLHLLVLGDRRGSGRAAARKKAEAIQKRAQKLGVDCALEVMDESDYRELVRRNIGGCTFAFCGGFDCCPGEYAEMLEGMVIAAGAQATTQVDEQLDFLVVGNRRGKGKAAAIKAAETAIAGGAKTALINEAAFLELVRKEGQHPTIGNDQTSSEKKFPAFLTQVYGTADERKVQRALKMLQKESYQLYSNVLEESVAGIVRSQTIDTNIYAPWIEESGKYGCSDTEYRDCMGLQGSVCKHLLVLLMGLVQVGELEPGRAHEWLRLAAGKRPKPEGNLAAQSLLQYKGAQAGELDWRPTETMPEDFYT